MLRARLMLTALWWVWGMILFVVLAILSNRIDSTQAWGWFLPNMLPALTLMGAAAYVGAKARAVRPVAVGVRMPLMLLAVLVSVTYLTLLTVAVVSPLYDGDPVKTMLTSNLWLSPMQVLALSTIGVFFAKDEKA